MSSKREWPDTKQWDTHDKFNCPLREIAFDITQAFERSKLFKPSSGEFDDMVDETHQILYTRWLFLIPAGVEAKPENVTGSLKDEIIRMVEQAPTPISTSEVVQAFVPYPELDVRKAIQELVLSGRLQYTGKWQLTVGFPWV